MAGITRCWMVLPPAAALAERLPREG